MDIKLNTYRNLEEIMFNKMVKIGKVLDFTETTQLDKIMKVVYSTDTFSILLAKDGRSVYYVYDGKLELGKIYVYSGYREDKELKEIEKDVLGMDFRKLNEDLHYRLNVHNIQEPITKQKVEATIQMIKSQIKFEEQRQEKQYQEKHKEKVSEEEKYNNGDEIVSHRAKIYGNTIESNRIWELDKPVNKIIKYEDLCRYGWFGVRNMESIIMGDEVKEIKFYTSNKKDSPCIIKKGKKFSINGISIPKNRVMTLLRNLKTFDANQINLFKKLSITQMKFCENKNVYCNQKKIIFNCEPIENNLFKIKIVDKEKDMTWDSIKDWFDIRSYAYTNANFTAKDFFDFMNKEFGMNNEESIELLKRNDFLQSI
jgi:hypothetical protein